MKKIKIEIRHPEMRPKNSSFFHDFSQMLYWFDLNLMCILQIQINNIFHNYQEKWWRKGDVLG